ncbi:MAG: M13 family metallopeptidase [Chitinophagaceae bacterium]
MQIRTLLIYVFVASLLISCKDTPNSTVQIASEDILENHIDTTVHPGNDFFAFANGAWIKKNPIPGNETGWGIFNLVDDENYARILTISEAATKSNANKGTPMQLIGDFFSAGMDSMSIEKQGIAPIQIILDSIHAIKNSNDIMHCIAWLQQIGVNSLFSMYVGQDMKNSEKNRLYISQGGLGLPDRDYYFNTDSNTNNIRNQYQQHIQKMFYLLHQDSSHAISQAKGVYAFEKLLASSHKQLAALRDPYANYNKWHVNKTEAEYPKMQWRDMLKQWNVSADSIIICQPKFLETAQQLLATSSVEVWKDYLTWHVISTFSNYLNEAYNKENFNFYSRILNGQKEQKPRWKRVLNTQENALGDALGQLFVKEYFPEKTKKRYEKLTEEIVESYRNHIQQLSWMSDSTKQKAIKKLNAITKKVGYPNTWKDYSAMDISRASYCQNVIASSTWHFNYEINKLNKPVDRTEWGMTPQTYNAYYNPSNNEIVLPAAIFTCPGYADDEVDDAVIYGYVGASTIGHELTHGFDDEGRQFDDKGNLENWWSMEDEKKFKERADKLVKQFNSYTVLGNLHPNGEATLGENIADLGGLVIALDAFKKTKQFQEGKKIAGYTPLQRYFMGFAYGWMQTRTDEKLKAQLLTDVHAPIFLRVNSPMSNCDEWYNAFQVTPSHALYVDSMNRVRIW